MLLRTLPFIAAVLSLTTMPSVSFGQAHEYTNTTGQTLNIFAVDVPKAQANVDCKNIPFRGQLGAMSKFTGQFPPDRNSKRLIRISKSSNPCDPWVFEAWMVPN